MSDNNIEKIIIKECNVGGKTTLLELVYYKLKEHFYTKKKDNNRSISERDEFNSAIEKIDNFWKKYKVVIQYLMRDQSSYNLDYEFVDHFDFNYKKENMKNDLNNLIEKIFENDVLFVFSGEDSSGCIEEYNKFIDKYLKCDSNSKFEFDLKTNE